MGYYIYNGVKLPKLPEWDKEAYPYAILRYVESIQLYSLFAGSTEGIHLPQGGGADSTPRVVMYPPFLQINLKNGVWAEPNHVTISAVGMSDPDAFWANHDILNEDGSVYLAASDPIPVPQLNPAALMQGFFTGEAVKRCRR